MNIIKYLKLIKPRIIFGNLISLTSGFLLASKNINIDYFYFFNILLGVSLIIASSCVFNNLIDQDIDKIMLRTKNRITAQNFSLLIVIIYAFLLLITGCLILFLFVNLTSLILTLIGFIIYVLIYSYYMKRKSINSILIGSLSGSLPPVIGYYAAKNNFDIYIIILFLTFIFWQIPHSYAITIRYFQDYKKAKIPTFPIIKGLKKSRLYIINYIILYIIFAFFLQIYKVGYLYLFISTITNVFWLLIAVKNYKNLDYKNWSKKVFLFSIFSMINLSGCIILDSIIFKIRNHI